VAFETDEGKYQLIGKYPAIISNPKDVPT